MWWMMPKEQDLAIKRMQDNGRDAEGKWNVQCFRNILLSWQLYAFTIGWALVELTCGINIMRWMSLWLSKVGYDKISIQVLPAMAGFVVCIILRLTYCILCANA